MLYQSCIYWVNTGIESKHDSGEFNTGESVYLNIESLEVAFNFFLLCKYNCFNENIFLNKKTVSHNSV